MSTFNSIPLQATFTALATAISMTAMPVAVHAGDDPMVEAARQAMEGASVRGTWQNPLLPAATGAEPPSRSADTIMAEQLAHYRRKLLDRGGWNNPYASGPGYDAGNLLLAVRPGNGFSSGSRPHEPENPEGR